MSLRYPPLLALRAFESAARHLSFTVAAAELCLTQSAVSRQIRSLEDFLGQKLFDRHVRAVVLTAAGQEYYFAVQHALNHVMKATQRIQQRQERAVIRLSVMPTLGIGWLMPRLASFSETYPDIDVRLVSSIEPANFQTGEVDAAIRVGRLPGAPARRGLPRTDLEMVTSWKGVVADYLFPDVLVPVLSRQLMDQHQPIRTPRDLLAYRLIHTASRSHAWPDWLAAHGVKLNREEGALAFGHFFMGLRAAQNCKGVAIVPSVVLRNFTESRQLVCPLPADVESAGSYYLLSRESDGDQASTHVFRNWLLAEAANELATDHLARSPFGPAGNASVGLGAF